MISRSIDDRTDFHSLLRTLQQSTEILLQAFADQVQVSSSAKIDVTIILPCQGNILKRVTNMLCNTQAPHQIPRHCEIFAGICQEVQVQIGCTATQDRPWNFCTRCSRCRSSRTSSNWFVVAVSEIYFSYWCTWSSSLLLDSRRAVPVSVIFQISTILMINRF